MAGFDIDSGGEGADERTIIRVSGTFDRASAHALVEHLGAAHGDLVLDFSLVREFADLGVATLATGLARSEHRLHLLGLRQHQLRIFRYFGVDVDALQASPPAADGAAAVG